MEAKYTVVVAEDEELLLQSLVRMIEQADAGFRVVGQAGTGTRALELTQELMPDLVVTDIKMPVMNGIDLLENICNKVPMTEFIITSGYSDFEYAKNAIRLHVSAYLLKPVDPDELKDSLLAVRTRLELEQDSYVGIFNEAMAQNSPKQIASALRAYLIHNSNVDINLNRIAQSMNYSPGYLTKIFLQQYGATPLKFMISLRISKAKQLLQHHPEMSIRQIGELVGYQDQGYFSRIFKRQTGQSPFEYRDSSTE